jgi:Holliday junction resolvase RusA-like endonuclease
MPGSDKWANLGADQEKVARMMAHIDTQAANPWPWIARMWRIEIPAGTKLLSANELRQVKHWSHYNATIRNLRRIANTLACAGKIPKNLPKIKVRAIYCPSDNRRRDSTQNYFPSVKACIDGLVDAKVISDDNDKIVVSVEMVRGENIKKSQLILEIIEVLNDGGRS